MTYQNNIVSIKVGASESTGYAFKSACGKSKYVITSKHSICIDKPTCTLISSGLNACRNCQGNINNSQISVKFENREPIIPIAYFISEKADVALLELDCEQPNLELLHCSFDDANDYLMWKHDKACILLDNKRLKDNSYALYNLKSSTFSEFSPKSQVIPGYSGTPIFSNDVHGTPILHAILTDNELNNDIGAELISRELLSELSLKSNIILNNNFSTLSQDICTSFIDTCFEFYYESNLGNDNKIKVYSVPFSDSNKFDLSRIVEYLTNNMSKSVFPPREIELSQGNEMKVLEAFRKFLSASNDIYSKPALLQNLVESDLLAPTLYKSTKQDEFSSIHIREFFPEKFEFVMSKYFSDSDLIESISNCAKSLKIANNNKSGSSLLLEPSFVQQSVSPKYAELISKLILPGHNIHVEYNFGLLSTYILDINSSIYSERNLNTKKKLIKCEIENNLRDKYEQISSIFNDHLFMGKTCYLYLIPINYIGELNKLMISKIN
ncbi:Hachiman antiphage defense system protein HamA [Photobacterium leiognathi]|uniref:Hachiman antiphage defense system protein HamA n=1 Tax=Photobacterium leiognathi TaxID=553611 RepID=UPI00273421C9|nr:Hachiman antiphage defense system protein HamA [Photobacterium leiognathi]